MKTIEHTRLDEACERRWPGTSCDPGNGASTLSCGDVYERDGNEMRDSGLYVDLAPWQCHVFELRAL